jgi:predicted metal-binding membrane protein
MLRQWLQARGFGPLGLLLWSVSLCAWLLIVGGDRLHVVLPLLCGGPSNATIPQGVFALDFAIQTVGWPALAGGSVLMVVAMMAPALAGPFLHLWYRSLSRHRWRAILLFIAGYLSIWTVVCVFLILTAYLLHGSTGSELGAGLVVAATGLAWQVSPARARCLARCHLRPRLSIFGVAAFTDPLLFGLTLACWCVATCWALMLLPLCLADAHLPLMAAGALLVAIERTKQSRPGRSGLVFR